jgi:hypothetical protein
MQRREFITVLGGAVAAWPSVAHAQPAKSPARIGFLPLGSQSNAYDRSLVEAFQRGLADLASWSTETSCSTSCGSPAIPTRLRASIRLIGFNKSPGARRAHHSIPINVTGWISFHPCSMSVT